MPGKVLIIDDDPVIVEAMSARLDCAGHEVHFASDGKSGLAAAEQLRPDVILLDITLPDMDGFEVNRRLKAAPDLADIPIIFVSANAKDWAKRAAFSMGAKFYLSKPYDFDRLLSAVGSTVEAAPACDDRKEGLREPQSPAKSPDH